MSTQGPPPNASDGLFESPDSDEPPEGLLLCEYSFKVVLSADFLKTLESLAHTMGVDRMKFNQVVFHKGIEALMAEIEIFKTEDYEKKVRELGGIGALAKRKEW